MMLTRGAVLCARHACVAAKRAELALTRAMRDASQASSHARQVAGVAMHLADRLEGEPTFLMMWELPDAVDAAVAVCRKATAVMVAAGRCDDLGELLEGCTVVAVAATLAPLIAAHHTAVLSSSGDIEGALKLAMRIMFPLGAEEDPGALVQQP
jgi:hypothetical protein